MQKIRRIFKDPRTFFGSADIGGMKVATDIVVERAAKVAKSQVTVTLIGDMIMVSDDGKMLDIERAENDLSNCFHCDLNRPLNISAKDFGLSEDARVTLVNYCSEFMNVKTFEYNGTSNSIEYSMRFERGLPASNSPNARLINGRKRGTSIHWRFDSSLFYNYTHEIPISYFKERLEELSVRYPQKRFALCIQPDIADPDTFERYEYKKG